MNWPKIRYEVTLRIARSLLVLSLIAPLLVSGDREQRLSAYVIAVLYWIVVDELRGMEDRLTQKLKTPSENEKVQKDG
jgi:hypothetical protein